MSERVDTNAVLREGADHQSSNPDVAPRAGQPMTELSEMLAEQTAGAAPETVKQPAVMALVEDNEWRFRTKVGLASTAIGLRLPIETDDTDDAIVRKNKYKRWLDRRIKQGHIDKAEVGKDGLLKADKAVFDLLGEYSLIFSPVRVNGKRTMEAEYTTSEKVVADYIRGRLERGEFAGDIYEEVRPQWVEINGQRIRVMPADDAARLAMAAAAAG